jgi:hypothetical protein
LKIREVSASSYVDPTLKQRELTASSNVDPTLKQREGTASSNVDPTLKQREESTDSFKSGSIYVGDNTPFDQGSPEPVQTQDSTLPSAEFPGEQTQQAKAAERCKSPHHSLSSDAEVSKGKTYPTASDSEVSKGKQSPTADKDEESMMKKSPTASDTEGSTLKTSPAASKGKAPVIVGYHGAFNWKSKDADKVAWLTSPGPSNSEGICGERPCSSFSQLPGTPAANTFPSTAQHASDHCTCCRRMHWETSFQYCNHSSPSAHWFCMTKCNGSLSPF